ncbi:MAG TPA: bacillithiol biosynthesis BshC [Candidatus Eisenbacteria bacterium]|nr:bacillithiol biosynthesis BshC [Candidatus Eisenbacteria bacterium]
MSPTLRRRSVLEDHMVPRPRRLSETLFDRWDSALKTWGAPPAAFDTLHMLEDPGTRVVITGQQPGPWGGPLYTLYKAATVLALAGALRELQDAPVAAVFWMQSEDTDWGEVGWGALPQPDLRLYRHRFESVLPSRHWIGSARITDPPDAQALHAEWKTGAWGRELLPRTEPYELASGFVRGLLSAFGDQGLLPLDGRWPELRSEAGALWERYVPRHKPLAQEVASRGRGQAPLDLEAASHGLFILDGEVRRQIDPSTWETDVARVLHEEPSRLAPSVLLRAPLQDHLFGPVAHVVGATEAAYLEQLTPVYGALGIEEPLRVPRLGVTVLPKDLVLRADWERALRDPEAVIAERAALETPPTAKVLLMETRQRLESTTERLLELLGDEQESKEGLNTMRKKIDLEFKRVEETLDRRGRRELYRQDARWRHLAEFLRPRRGPQERGISGGMLPWVFGDEAPAVLGQAARDHIATWREGRSAPILLEALRV